MTVENNIQKPFEEWELYADWSENARDDWEGILDDWGDEWQIDFFKSETVEAYSDMYDNADNATEALCSGLDGLCSDNEAFLRKCFRGASSVLNDRNSRLAVLCMLLDGVNTLSLATAYGGKGSNNWSITCSSDAIDTINEVLTEVSKYYGVNTEYDLDEHCTWSYEVANYDSSTGWASRYC